MIKTFRGMLADGGQDRIRLQTIKGKVGYKIVKFQAIANLPGTTAQESIIKIYKTSQSTINATVDFTDSSLLGVVLWQLSNNINYPQSETIIFDNEIFNQDIYLTHTETESTQNCNYYLELEVIPLDDKAAEYTILKDIRQVKTAAI